MYNMISLLLSGCCCLVSGVSDISSTFFFPLVSYCQVFDDLFWSFDC